MRVVAVFLLLGAAINGFLAFLEFQRWSENSGSAFSGIAFNSAVYLLGIALTAFFAGVGFIVADNRIREAKSSSAPPA